jgi:signal peptidase I
MFVKPYKVVSNSMKEVISSGDLVYTIKNLGLSTYKRNDILSFKKETNTTFIKRALAVSGDTIFFKNDFIQINGSQIPHDSIFGMMVEESAKTDSSEYYNATAYSEYLLSRSGIKELFGKYILAERNGLVVPVDYYFMVGDNYYESMDSRFWGFIPEKDITGKIIFIF